jgi:hypothetical protein
MIRTMIGYEGKPALPRFIQILLNVHPLPYPQN